VINARLSDWLDDSCWQCGSEHVRPDDDGRILCEPCRMEIFDSPRSPEDGLAVALRLYWESHPLERCWRCMARPVDPEDGIGICRACRSDVRKRTAVEPL
jgi:hypothetical protein